MPTVRSLTLALKQQMSQIQSLSDQLRDQLYQLPVKAVSLYELPDFEKEDEKEQPDFIPVSTCDQQQALDKAIHALSAYYAKDDSLEKRFSTRLVKRYPGFIQFDLNSCPPDLKLLILNLNQAKLDFMTTLKENTKDHQAQWDLIHQLFKRIMTHQLKRKIIVADHPATPDRLRFYWAKKMSSPKVNKQQAIIMLERCLHRPPAGQDQEAWTQLIQSQINQLSMSTDKLVIRRPVRIKPMIKLSYKNAYGSDPLLKLRAKECSATTPILVFSKQALKITPLADYHKPKVDKIREYEADLINAQLHLYRVPN